MVATLASALCATIAPAQDPELRRLRQEMQQAFDREDWPAAIEIGLRVAEMQPLGGVAAYNLACAYARNGDTANALAWLEKAAEQGFSVTRLVASDSDLDSLRDDEAFDEIAARITANREQEFEWFVEEARATEPLVLLPDGYDPEKPAPLIIALHGRGGNGKSIAVHWKEIANEVGAIVVAPDALRPLVGGYEWRFVDESEWLTLFTLDRMLERYAIDERRVVLTGFSQGAQVAFTTGVRHPERFCGLVLVSGNYDADDAEIARAGEAPMPSVWLAIGSEDPSVATYREALEDFKAAGWKAKLRVVKGVGHTFPLRDAKELRKVLAFACDR